MVIKKSVERECFGCKNPRPAEHFKSKDSEVCDYCKLKAGISSPRLEQAKKQLAKDEKRQSAQRRKEFKQKREDHAEEMHFRILEAARQIVEEHGDLKVITIAARTGCSPANLYNYFETPVVKHITSLLGDVGPAVLPPIRQLQYSSLTEASVDSYLCFWEVVEGAASVEELAEMDTELEILNQQAEDSPSKNPDDYTKGGVLWNFLRQDTIADQKRLVEDVAENSAYVNQNEYEDLVLFLIETKRNGFLDILAFDKRVQNYIEKALNREMKPSRALKEIGRLKNVAHAEILRARYLLGYDNAGNSLTRSSEPPNKGHETPKNDPQKWLNYAELRGRIKATQYHCLSNAFLSPLES